jgi:hypothetical protein
MIGIAIGAAVAVAFVAWGGVIAIRAAIRRDPDFDERASAFGATE